jgi:hypothetical protein
MRLKDVLVAIETEIHDNWPGLVHFDDSIAHPSVDEWVHVNVVPITSVDKSYDGCSYDLFGVYVACYARTKVKAYDLADRFMSFLTNKKIGGVYLRDSHPVDQGNVNRDRFYSKFVIYANN